MFKNGNDPEAEYEEINRIHTPKEITRMLSLADEYSALPALKKSGLRDCQFEAITELEKSFRSGQNRALMVLATGAGKTYTACLAAYRFLSYTPMKRVTLWGVTDDSSWKNGYPVPGRTNYPLLWNRDYTPHKALQSVLDVPQR